MNENVTKWFLEVSTQEYNGRTYEFNDAIRAVNMLSSFDEDILRGR